MGQKCSKRGLEPSAVGDGRTTFHATDFRVPTAYLELLIGREVARQMLAQEHDRTGHLPQFIPSLLFLKLCLKRMRVTRDESYGTASRPVPKGTLGILMAAASHGRTFSDALARFCEAAALMRPDVTVRYTRGARGHSIQLSYGGPRSARMELLLETHAISLHCAFRWLTGVPLRLQRVRIAAPIGVFQRSLLRGVVGCQVLQRGSGVTIGYGAEVGALPLAAVKYEAWAAHEFSEFMALLHEAAARQAARAIPPMPRIIDDVQKAILAGHDREAVIAARLRMSPATLRRRLAEVGLSFRELLQNTRRDLAATLLMTDKPLEDVAAEMHYSDVRSFRRACYLWFGTTPGAYRTSRSAAAADPN